MTIFDSLRYPIGNDCSGVSDVPFEMMEVFRNNYRSQPGAPAPEWLVNDMHERLKFIRKVILEWDGPQ